MAECTQQQQHPITRQAGRQGPLSTICVRVCGSVCVCVFVIHSLTHTKTGGSDGLVSTCPPVITQEVMEGNRERDEGSGGRREEGGGREGGKGRKQE